MIFMQSNAKNNNNSEASDKYIKAINRMNIITFLTSFLLSGDHCPSRVIIAAGNFFEFIIIK